MRNTARWLAIALLLLPAFPVAAKKGPEVASGRLEFRLPDLDGNPVASDDPRFDDKVLLVDLWGTWCPPCLSEIPTFIELQREYGDEGFMVVAIAFEDEDAETRRERLKAFAAEQGIDYLILDGGPPDGFASALPGVTNVRGLPVEMLVDRTGRVRSAKNGYGYKKKWARKLRAEIELLLSEEPP